MKIDHFNTNKRYHFYIGGYRSNQSIFNKDILIPQLLQFIFDYFAKTVYFDDTL